MTGPFVVDASVAAAWGLPDEGTAETKELHEAAIRSYVLVPAIFPIEVQNILWTAERRGRITSMQGDAFWKALSLIDIRVVAQDHLHGEPIALQYSRMHSLTAYDASYLALAHSSGLSLATADRELQIAARTLGILTLPF